MRHLTFTLALLLSAGSLAAQSEFAPIGAVWHYSSTLAFSPPSFIRLEVVSDSVVMGRPCSKLDMLNFYWPEPGMLLHQHGDSVLFYNPLVGDFDLLYPFGAQAGTMWTHRVAYPQSGDTTFLQYRLDSVSLVTIQNRELRRLHISKAVKNAYYPIAEVTESIGSSYFILYSFLEFTYALYNIVYEGPFPDGLRCYYDPAFGLYETGLALGCDAVSAKDMPEPEDIRVFPNPSSGEIAVDLPDEWPFADLAVFDALGRLVLRRRVADRESILLPSPGWYYFAFYKDAALAKSVKVFRK